MMSVKKIGLTPQKRYSAEEMQSVLKRNTSEEKEVWFVIGIQSADDVDAAEEILRQKEHSENLFLECVLPYETVMNDWSEELRDRFFSVMERCDNETMLQPRCSADSAQKLEAYICHESNTAI